MINKQSINKYFDSEAQSAREAWESLMAFPIKERIRKRRTIQRVFFDKDYEETSESGYLLKRVSFSTNLSDFKEGDPLLLHKEDTTEGIECTLVSFEGDNAVIVEVFPPNMPSDIESYYDVPLILDKNCVDLRENVYYHFLDDTSSEQSFWEGILFNTKPAPLFENKKDIKVELEDTIKNYHLSLLPCQKDAILNSMSTTNYYLIQGPPGTGKSFVLGLIILEELLYFERKVAIIGPNHMAINNAMGQVLKIIPKASAIFIKIGQSFNKPQEKVHVEDTEFEISNIPYLNVGLANSFEHPMLYGLTPHALYTNRGRDLEFDTLIIDEAGQMTIPLALMGMVKAKKVILAGDHKQLPPIIPETVEGELSISAFESLLTGENCTMLDTSFRMCEPICNFVSDLFYEGKVKPFKKGCSDLLICESPLFSFNSPIVFHNVDDSGEQTSDLEAIFITEAITGFLERGINPTDLAVLSPFRAQAANIRRRIRKIDSIPESDRALIVSDTVDKMQGQEREIILFSLTAGDPNYLADMADFLLNPNKLNVAFSRAKSKLIIVGNFKQLEELDLDDYPHVKKLLEYASKLSV